MPITKSAKKALRQSKRREERNRVWKVAVKKATKNVERLVAAKKTKEIPEALSHAYKTIDKATKNYIMHKNKAARMKSHLAKLLNSK